MIYDIWYKTLIVQKPLRIRFNKIDGFIGVYDSIRYFIPLGPRQYDTIYEKNRYLIL